MTLLRDLYLLTTSPSRGTNLFVAAHNTLTLTMISTRLIVILQNKQTVLTHNDLDDPEDGDRKNLNRGPRKTRSESDTGQVRYITRPKSEAMRVTRQLRLPPRDRRVCI